MDKSLRVAKMNIGYMVNSLMWFYIMLSAYLFLIVPNIGGTEEVIIAGLEVFTGFFMVKIGYDAFKNNFYFSQSVNVSRKSLIKGLIISIFPMAISVATFDVLLNRGLNAFTKVPTIYDRSFGNYGLEGSNIGWIQENSIQVILNTIMFLFTLYCLFYMIGLTMAIIYYKSNNVLKVVIPISVIVLFEVVDIFDKINLYKINEYFKRVLNLEENNILPALISNGIILLGLCFIAKLLMNKITMKKV